MLALVRTLLLSICALAALGATPDAPEAAVLHANGGSWNAPGNTIDGLHFGMVVRNEGCPQTGSCPAGSAATHVRVVEGGTVNGAVNDGVTVRDDSTFTVDGGRVFENVSIRERGRVTINAGQLTDGDYPNNPGSTPSGNQVQVEGQGTFVVNGGAITGHVVLAGFSNMRWKGGTLDGELVTYSDTVTVVVNGSGFSIDGVPVPYGTRTWGADERLTGLLLSGDEIDETLVAPFAGFGGPGSVVLTLVPEPGTGVLVGVGLAAFSLRRRRETAAGV